MDSSVLRCSVFASCLVVTFAWGAPDAQPSQRQQAQNLQALAGYLELDDAQRQSLLEQRASHQREWQPLISRAQALAGNAAQQGGTTSALAQLCQQSQELRARQRAQARQLLNPRQLDKVALLEEAFALMPMVEAAQAAGLVANHLDVPPAGFSGGMVTVATGWLRTPAVALPGCSATRVLREVELKGSGERKLPPMQR